LAFSSKSVNDASNAARIVYNNRNESSETRARQLQQEQYQHSTIGDSRFSCAEWISFGFVLTITTNAIVCSGGGGAFCISLLIQ
jgi:hypothetical protein